jgi:hypothetical protein
MNLQLKIVTKTLNFALAACFLPSMFASHTDDECMFEFDDLHSNKGPQPAAPKKTRHEASSSHSAEDEDIFPFELTDETPPTQLVVPLNATSPYDTDNEEEESDDDTPYIEEIPASPHAPVAKSNAIRIKPRSQSDLTSDLAHEKKKLKDNKDQEVNLTLSQYQ